MSKDAHSHDKRRYVRFGLLDEIVDSVHDGGGKEYALTMRGWHWNNLDWIKRNTPITEDMLVGDAIINLVEKQQEPMDEREYKGELTLSQSMEATIYFFIDSYDKARKERIARESNKGKDVAGSA